MSSLVFTNEEGTGCFTLTFFSDAVVNVLCFFLTVPWAGLQSVIVTFPGRTHLFYEILFNIYLIHSDLSIDCIWV